MKQPRWTLVIFRALSVDLRDLNLLNFAVNISNSSHETLTHAIACQGGGECSEECSGVNIVQRYHNRRQ